MSHHNKKHPGMVAVPPNKNIMASVREQIIAQQFDERFQPALKAETFPSDALNGAWISAAKKAFRKMSPIKSGLTNAELKEIWAKLNGSEQPVFSLYEFAAVSNTIETLCADEMQIPVEMYFDTLDVAEAAAAKWNEITGDIRTRVIKEIEEGTTVKPAPEELDEEKGVPMDVTEKLMANNPVMEKIGMKIGDSIIVPEGTTEDSVLPEGFNFIYSEEHTKRQPGFTGDQPAGEQAADKT